MPGPIPGLKRRNVPCPASTPAAATPARPVWATAAGVPKSILRVNLYGSVDELNSFLGVAVSLLNDDPDLTDYAGVDIPVVLEEMQNRLFDLGAVLANPVQSAGPVSFPTLGMEQLIDTLEQELEPLKNFILPGGHPAAAHLHVARATSRRVERLAVALAETEPIPASAVAWLNRLSDFLFVASRAVNAAAGHADVLWHPEPAPEDDQGA